MRDVFELAHRDAQGWLQRGAPVYLTINPVEYHGPHLSLHNDLLLSRGVIKDMHERWLQRYDAPLLVASDLEMGVGPTKGPGSRAVTYDELRKHTLNAVKALRALGAQRVVLMTFHGDPFHNLAIERAVEWLRGHGVAALAPFHLLMREMMTVDPRQYENTLRHVEDPVERRRLLQALPTDFHAGFFETSLALHYCPDTVSPIYRELPPCPTVTPDRLLLAAAKAARWATRPDLARELEFAAIGTGWHALRPFPGYTGAPHLATREAGAIFAVDLVNKFSNAMREVFELHAAPPRPIMTWLPTLAAPRAQSF